MAADPADVARLVEMADAVPDAGACAALNTVAEVIAYIVACARSEGLDEIDSVELVLAVAQPPRAAMCEAEPTLRRLGYVGVADLLLRLIRKTRRPRKPTGRPRTDSARQWQRQR